MSEDFSEVNPPSVASTNNGVVIVGNPAGLTQGGQVGTRSTSGVSGGSDMVAVEDVMQMDQQTIEILKNKIRELQEERKVGFVNLCLFLSVGYG